VTRRSFPRPARDRSNISELGKGSGESIHGEGPRCAELLPDPCRRGRSRRRLPDRAGRVVWPTRQACPPNWVFGPVWTVLYVLTAIAGWRVWRRDRAGMSIKLWWAQLAINFAWSPVVFVAHQTALALVVVLLLLVAILAFIAASGGRIALRRGCSYHMRRG